MKTDGECAAVKLLQILVARFIIACARPQRKA